MNCRAPPAVHKVYPPRMAGHASSLEVVLAALIGNAPIAVSKFSAAAFAGGSAMFSGAIHSLVDSGEQALALLGLERSRENRG